METTLHRQLKERFGAPGEGRLEVALGGFRIDAVDRERRLVEVQSGALGPLRGKLARLLAEHQVRVVKPVVLERRIVRRARLKAPDLSARRSPKRGAVIDVFDDLVGLVSIFPHPNLMIDVLSVAIDEIRVPRRRKRSPGYKVVDRQLRSLLGSSVLRDADDLWSLLPADVESPFTTIDLAEMLSRSIDFAQRVAYCLRLSGAARVVGKVGNRRIYMRSTASARQILPPSG